MNVIRQLCGRILVYLHISFAFYLHQPAHVDKFVPQLCHTVNSTICYVPPTHCSCHQGGFFIALLRKKAELPAPTWLRTNQREDGRIPTVSSQPDHHRWRPIPFKLQERAATSSQHDRFDSLGQPLRQYARSDAYRRWFGVSASLAAHAFDSIGSARLNIVSAGVVTHTSEGLGTPVPIVQW